ncbi:MAG: hypothetical protein OXU73_00050 [Candidatus Campbellbacteria bacterium]|nr:hypothetical protein [Candidatus Campbellbacteria bacterium]
MINIQIKRKNNEQTSSMLRRFSQRTRAAKIIPRARKSRFSMRLQSLSVRRKGKLRYIRKKDMLNNLYRLGKLVPRKSKKK